MLKKTYVFLLYKGLFPFKLPLKVNLKSTHNKRIDSCDNFVNLYFYSSKHRPSHKTVLSLDFLSASLLKRSSILLKFLKNLVKLFEKFKFNPL